MKRAKAESAPKHSWVGMAGSGESPTTTHVTTASQVPVQGLVQDRGREFVAAVRCLTWGEESRYGATAPSNLRERDFILAVKLPELLPGRVSRAASSSWSTRC